MIMENCTENLGMDFDDKEWLDITSAFQSYENVNPGADVFLDRRCKQIIGYCDNDLVIDWNDCDEIWKCSQCSAEYNTMRAADSCCLQDKEAIHFAIEYGYLKGAQVDVQMSFTMLNEDGTVDLPDSEKLDSIRKSLKDFDSETNLYKASEKIPKPELKSGPVELEEDISFADKLSRDIDFDAIATKH